MEEKAFKNKSQEQCCVKSPFVAKLSELNQNLNVIKPFITVSSPSTCRLHAQRAVETKKHYLEFSRYSRNLCTLYRTFYVGLHFYTFLLHFIAPDRARNPYEPSISS